MKRLLLAAWEVWERLFARWYHLKDISGAGLLRVAVRRYRGKAVQLKDGTVIRSGDLIGELHLASLRILEMHRHASSSTVVAREVARQVGASVGRLQEMLISGEIPAGVTALYGVTLFYRGAGMLGFEIREAGPWTRCWQSVYLRWLMALYHPAGRERLGTGRTGWVPKEIWLSRQSLQSRQV